MIAASMRRTTASPFALESNPMTPQIPHMRFRSHPGKRGKLSEAAAGYEPIARRAVSRRTSGERFAAELGKLEAEKRKPWRQRIRVRLRGSWMACLPSRVQHDREFVEATIRRYEIAQAEYAQLDRTCNLGRSREDPG